MKSITDKQEAENLDNNLLKIYGFIGIVSFLPIWIFRGNLNYFEVAILFVIFFLIPVLIHLIFIKFLFKKNTKFYNIILSYYISLISVHGIDHNLGLWSFILYLRKKIAFVRGEGIEHIDYIYSTFSIIIFSLVIFFFIYLLKKNGLKILAVSLVTVLLINILDYRKNLSSFPKVNRHNNEYFNENLNYTNKTLIIILDGMMGINNVVSNHTSGLKVKKNIKNLFDKYKFAYYINARSVGTRTIIVMPTLLNFHYKTKQITPSEKLALIDINKNLHNSDKHKLPFKKSKNYFVQYELTSNKFFDNEKYNGIVVYQNDILSYCEHYKVIKCHQFNPFDRENIYLEGFKNNLLSRALTIYKNSLSILGADLYRLGRYFKLTDTSAGQIGEKASFPQRLKKVENSLNIEKSNLVFAHLVVPHLPFGFDENCKFDGGRQTGGGEKLLHPITAEDNIIQHNVERNCVVYYLDTFLDNLRTKEYWKDLEIVIMSDHGARITSEEEELLSVIFAIKTKKISPGLYNDNVTTSHLFYKINN